MKAMIDSMNEEHLHSVKLYAGTVGKKVKGAEKPGDRVLTNSAEYAAQY